MNLRLTGGLVLILLGLAGYIYFFEWRSPPSADESSIYGPVYGEYDIVGLEIAGPEQTIRFVRTEQAPTQPWAMVEPHSLPPAELDQVRVNGAATRLGRLQAGQVITGVHDLAQYGLASPRLTVTLTLSSGREIRFYSGDASPVGDNRYLRLPDDDRSVYLVYGFAIDELHRFIQEPPLAP